MKKLITIFFGGQSSGKSKRNLKDFKDQKFQDALIPMEFPNVGTYKTGSLTKK